MEGWSAVGVVATVFHASAAEMMSVSWSDSFLCEKSSQDVGAFFGTQERFTGAHA